MQPAKPLGTHACMSFKHGTEIAGIFISHPVGNFIDSQRTFTEHELFAAINPLLIDIEHLPDMQCFLK